MPSEGGLFLLLVLDQRLGQGIVAVFRAGAGLVGGGAVGHETAWVLPYRDLHSRLGGDLSREEVPGVRAAHYWLSSLESRNCLGSRP